MDTAFQTFHHGLIDYAGLFPPASLSLEQSLKNYVAYLNCDEAWMLGSFILPANQINNAATILKTIATSKTLNFSLLPSEHLTEDLKKFNQFAEKSNHTILLQSLEIRIPENDNLRFIEQTAQIAGDEHMIYFEPSRKHGLTAITQKIQQLNAGLKLRCGGIEASMIPSVETVAHVIAQCTSQHIPMKFTAGLHHPLRHFSEAHRAMLHGFTNLFSAAILSHTHSLTENKIAEILNDENSSSFEFLPDSMQWKTLTASQTDLIESRAQIAHSYGSCSFDEPREDLTKLGWLS